MTAKEWLERVQDIDAEIRELKEDRESLFSFSLGSDEKVQCSRKNTEEEKMVNYAEYSTMIAERIEGLYAVKREVVAAIYQIEKRKYRKLLYARYINFKSWESWEKYAEKIHKSTRHIYRLHDEALKEIEKIIF